MSKLEELRTPTPLDEHNRTRIAKLITWCTVRQVARMAGVSWMTLRKALEGEPLQMRTKETIISALDRLHNDMRP